MKVRFFCCIFFLFGFFASHAQQLIRFSGKITGADAAPLPGASVYLLNTNRGTISDANGNFEFKNVNPGSYVMQVSSVGYASVTLPVVLNNSSKQELTIQLKEASTELDAVLVSAQKREETLQQVPFSISTLSARQIQQYRLWNAQELTAIVPNLYSANPGDERNVTSIRGIAATSYDPAVATYIDGVNQFGLDTYIAQLLDVERIEILRGPQGTLYGRNAMGGVINIITKKPSNKTSGFAEVTAGNFAQQRYSAGLKIPLVKNKLFAGASALYASRNGFYANEFNNLDFDGQNNFSGNYYLNFIANDKWTMSLNVKHNGNKNQGAFPLVNGAEDALKNPFRLSQDAVATMIDNTLNGSFVVNYAGKPFSFSSQTAYQSNHRYYNQPLDGDFSPIDGVTVINDYGDKWNRVKVWTQEFKFSSPASSVSSWKWTAGSYLFINTILLNKPSILEKMLQWLVLLILIFH
jgi:iron complex outermembrane receptor protein